MTKKTKTLVVTVRTAEDRKQIEKPVTDNAEHIKVRTVELAEKLANQGVWDGDTFYPARVIEQVAIKS